MQPPIFSPDRGNFSLNKTESPVWKCYETISSCTTHTFIEIEGNQKVGGCICIWRANQDCSQLCPEQLLCISCALQTSCVLHIAMNVYWHEIQLFVSIKKKWHGKGLQMWNTVFKGVRKLMFFVTWNSLNPNYTHLPRNLDITYFSFKSYRKTNNVMILLSKMLV